MLGKGLFGNATALPFQGMCNCDTMFRDMHSAVRAYPANRCNTARIPRRSAAAFWTSDPCRLCQAAHGCTYCWATSDACIRPHGGGATLLACIQWHSAAAH